MKYAERLRRIPDRSHRAEQPYPAPGTILFVAASQLLVFACLPAAFIIPAGLRWLWACIAGPLALLWYGVAYSCRCPSCRERVLIAWPEARFRKQQPYEVAILFTRRFQCRSCGQRFRV